MEGFVYTVPMALTDYIPVVLFGISALLLCRDLKNKMSKAVFATLVIGVIVAFLAGFLKATYKLLIATGIGEIAFFNDFFLPTVLKGCVAWAKEHGVKEVTAAEMKIINDKRSKEKGKG